MCLCASFLVRIAGAGAASSPLLPAPAFTFLTGSPCYILTISLFFHKHHPFLGLISTLLMSIETCAYVLLSWYALRGRALRPPPCTPPPAFIFLTGSHLYLLFFCFFISIILSLGSFQLYWYPSRHVPMCFFLGTHCGGRRCALPPAPRTRFYFFNRLPLLYTYYFFVFS